MKIFIGVLIGLLLGGGGVYAFHDQRALETYTGAVTPLGMSFDPTPASGKRMGEINGKLENPCAR
jgi:hypothetical protein